MNSSPVGTFTLDGTLLASVSVYLFLFLFGELTTAGLISAGINDVHNAVLKSGARMPGKFSSIFHFILPFFRDDAIFHFFLLLSKLH